MKDNPTNEKKIAKLENEKTYYQKELERTLKRCQELEKKLEGHNTQWNITCGRTILLEREVCQNKLATIRREVEKLNYGYGLIYKDEVLAIIDKEMKG